MTDQIATTTSTGEAPPPERAPRLVGSSAEPRRNAAALAVAAIALVAAVSGCGFDDSLTSRGFIVEGDRICGETIVATAFELEADGGFQVLGAETVLERLGIAYGDAGRRLHALDTHESDDSFRKRMSSGFEAASRRLRAVSAAEDLETAASEAFADTGTFLSELKSAGFRICGERLSRRG